MRPPSDPSPSVSNPAVDPEQRWLEETFRGPERQLTVRAVLTGMLIGAVMCLSNLYVVLKTGWSIGVTVTAAIMAWALWSGLRVARLSRRPVGLLENGAMGSVASAAGYMTGGGNIAALPALIMLTGVRPDALPLMLWFGGIAALGVFAAVPIKRQLVNREQLAFPTGTATAETLRALHATGAEGHRKALLLGGASAIGAAVAWLRDAKAAWMPFQLPGQISLPFSIGGRPAIQWTLGLEGSVLMLGAGALMSFRAGWSLLLGAGLAYGVLAPAAVDAGVIAKVEYKALVNWLVWPGAALLVSSGLTSFALQWRSVARSFSGLSRLVSRRAPLEVDPLAAVEVPTAWFLRGFLLVGPLVVFLGWYLFHIPIWAGLLALPLALLMGLIAARVTGETDVTPTKALGPVTQLVYGALLPQRLVPNLMSANITGGVGLHAADLLTDLKTGWLLGAKPRQQLVAQLFGVLAGAAVVVPAFNLLIPDASVLGGAEFPAPGAQVWAGVSKMLVDGIGTLHPSARWAALAGLVAGVALAVAEKLVPRRLAAYVPSPSGLGIGMVVPGFSSIMMCLGASAAELYRRRSTARSERAPGGSREGLDPDAHIVPVASGFIAGESLLGVVVKLLVAVGLLAK